MDYIKRKQILKTIKDKSVKIIKSPLYIILYPIYWADKVSEKMSEKMISYRKSKLTDEKIVKHISKKIEKDLICGRHLMLLNAEKIDYDYKDQYDTLLSYSIRRFKFSKLNNKHIEKYLNAVRYDDNREFEWNLKFTKLICNELKAKGYNVTINEDDTNIPTWCVKGFKSWFELIL